MPWLRGKEQGLQQISTHEVNVRILVDIPINHNQIANASKLMHPQTIAETCLRIAEIALRLHSHSTNYVSKIIHSHHQCVK